MRPCPDLFVLRQDDAVDHVNDAVRRVDVGLHDLRAVNGHAAIAGCDRERVPADSLRRAGFDHVGRHDFPGDDMRREDALQLGLFSGFSSASSVPAGSFANGSSVGANTVKGPAPFSVSTRSAAWSAFASVLNDPAATAVSTMSLSAVAAPMLAAAPVMVMAATIPAITSSFVSAP